ncbi:MAG: hypothetical protein FJ265_00980 [Planctomycetes bacterium]|nr:hypothetical protein [Planctomycetota bacterium]
MDVRLALASLLFLHVAAPAQEVKPDAAAQKPPAAAPQQPPAPAAQDPDKPAPKPVDVVGDLQREKERLQQEIDYAKLRAKDAKSMLAQKLGRRGQTFRSIDAGTSFVAPAAPPPRREARLMTPEELKNQPADVMLLVNGRPIRQGLYDDLFAYLGTVPNSGDDALRAQIVLLDLVRTESMVAAFPGDQAAAQAASVLGQLQGGQPIAELARSFGTVQGGKEDGSIEITRSSYLGLSLEKLAFAAKVGEPTAPVTTPMGLAILVVDGIEKGATADLDKVKAHAVLVKWQADPAAVQKAQLAASQGQVEIVVRDQRVMDLLPMLFKPAPAAPIHTQVQAVDSEISAVFDTLKQIDAAIARLSSETSEDAKAQVEQLKKQRAELQKALDDMRKQEGHDAPVPFDGQPVKPAAPNAPTRPVEKKGEKQ